MTESTAPPKSSPLPAAAERRRPAALPLVLLAGWAVQVAVRLWLAGSRSHPVMHPDEAGYLIAARWLTGGPAADLSGFSLYQGGYSILLVPAHLFGAGSETVYGYAIVLNALLAAALFPLGHLALKRLGLKARNSLPLAWAAALLPATTIYGDRALADALLPVVMLGWLLCLDRFVRDPRTATALAASALASYAHATHMRGTMLLMVHVAVLGAVLLRRRARRPTIVAIAAAGLGSGAATLLNSRIREAIYPFGARDHARILLDHLTGLDGQLWAWTGSTGQIWAMVCGTWGLGGLGLLTVTITVVRRRTPREERIIAAALIALTFGIAYASAAALPDEERLGNHAYARYLSCVALPYTLIGLVSLIKGARPVVRTVTVMALIGITGLAVALYIGEDRLKTSSYYPSDFPVIGMLGFSYTELRIPLASLSACILLLVLLALRTRSRLALFSGLMTINLFAVWIITIVLDLWGAEPNTPIPGSRSGGVAIERPQVGVERPDPDYAHPLPELIYSRVAYQVDWTRLKRFDKDGGLPGEDICTAVVFWPIGVLAEDSWVEHPPGWRYRRAGDGRKKLWWVIWYDPNCPAHR